MYIYIMSIIHVHVQNVHHVYNTCTYMYIMLINTCTMYIMLIIHVHVHHVYNTCTYMYIMLIIHVQVHHVNNTCTCTSC